VRSQVLYSFDRVIGILVLGTGLVFPALAALGWRPVWSILLIGLIFGLHVLYSLLLFRAFKDPVLLLAAPIYMMRNGVFLLAYLLGWIWKGWQTMARRENP
jgi:hypothetical protein